jgi:glycosyltransferase involved in cell wall biosynthesis
VRAPTYNHERYIAQCLEGILMQRTNFPFEVIVGEDCSTDRTREIVRDYERRYPTLIRVVTSERNVGVSMNAKRVNQACRGKYLAMCEGDDYWIDPLKLQKQVEFMETYPDVSLCFHNALILNEKHGAVRLFFENEPDPVLGVETACRLTIPTASVMVRHSVMAVLPDWRSRVWCGDLVVRLWCAHVGHLGFLRGIMSVYRRHPGGLETRMRAHRSRSYYDDVLFCYREFDKATAFAHTELIQCEMARLQEDSLRERLGRWYFLRRPRYAVVRLQQYVAWLRRQRHLLGP